MKDRRVMVMNIGALVMFFGMLLYLASGYFVLVEGIDDQSHAIGQRSPPSTVRLSSRRSLGARS